MTVRTRYAPSPTGDPHVGNLRTALFAWALARANGGQFLLRIEDTDQKRLVRGSLEAIYQSLRWLGITWDEGPDVGGPHVPYVESERLPLYHQQAARLIEKRRAYRCFCTPERLDQLRARQAAAKQPPGYDGLCRDLPAEESQRRSRQEPFVIRFAMDRTGATTLDDAIRGQVRFDNALQDDFVMVKSDGFPTYHLAGIADDHEMRISHVIRGEEWLSSTPKHLQLIQALGYTCPVYAHLPLILGSDHKKLGKRTGDTSALQYRDRGYLAEAMVNFLALLGWSLDDHTSIINREELARHFSLERVVPNPAVFDVERLDYLNGHYIRALPDEEWRQAIVTWCEQGLPSTRPIDPRLVEAVAPLLRERVARLDQIPGLMEFLFGFEAPEYAPEALTERLGGDGTAALAIIDQALLALDAVPRDSWDLPHVEAAIRSMEATLGLKLRKLVPVLYVAEMGRSQGIPLFDSLVLLGRERALQRLRSARGRLDHHR